MSQDSALGTPRPVKPYTTAMSSDQIVTLPTPENSVVRLHATDNVAVARVSLSPGQKFVLGEVRIEVIEAVPAGESRIPWVPTPAAIPV